MKVRIAIVAPLSLLLAAFTVTAASPAHAQDQSANAHHHMPPTILVINTEMLKPGQAGSPHEKTEAAFVQTAREANSPDHYIGLDSMSGRSRAVFLHGFDSFADWQKMTQGDMQNASLDADYTADGALLNQYMTSVYHFHKDLSLNPGTDLGKTRYFELTVYRVRMGHQKDWDTVVKQFRDAYAKIPGSHWDMFEKLYGENSGDTYLLAVPMESLADVDANMMNDKKLKDVVGADQLQKMRELAEATIESVVSNLYAVNPKMSYETTAVTQEDTAFWGQ